MQAERQSTMLPRIMTHSKDRRCLYHLAHQPANVVLANDNNKHNEEVFKWSGEMPLPEIGQQVKIYAPGFGSGVVTGYFLEYGWVGVYVQLAKDQRPAWHKKQRPNDDYYMAFGIDLIPVSK